MKIPDTPAEIKQQMTREDTRKLFADHKADPHGAANKELQALFVATQGEEWSPATKYAAERWMALREVVNSPPSAAEQAAAKANEFTQADIDAAYVAQGQFKALKLNKEFMAAFNGGDKGANEHWNTLIELMQPIFKPPLGHREKGVWHYTPDKFFIDNDTPTAA